MSSCNGSFILLTGGCYASYENHSPAVRQIKFSASLVSIKEPNE